MLEGAQLSVNGISRRFGERMALQEVSFDVRAGRLTGFVGANGAGKTTAMRIMLGVLAADGGSVVWGGRPITSVERRCFGYIPEERGLYPKLKVAQQIAYFGRLHGLSRAAATRATDELLEQLSLTERATTPSSRCHWAISNARRSPPPWCTTRSR